MLCELLTSSNLHKNPLHPFRLLTKSRNHFRRSRLVISTITSCLAFPIRFALLLHHRNLHSKFISLLKRRKIRGGSQLNSETFTGNDLRSSLVTTHIIYPERSAHFVNSGWKCINNAQRSWEEQKLQASVIFRTCLCRYFLFYARFVVISLIFWWREEQQSINFIIASASASTTSNKDVQVWWAT